jgi:basic amino acid/polyamine antiporter, APA family
MTSSAPQPKQQIGLVGAVAIGLASMLGAGVFVVFHTAYTISPTGYYWALALAAVVAILNSWSVYSLARMVDRPGGIYAYSRIYLTDGFSFAAGFAFVFGKIGSIAAIALAFNSYLLSGYKFWPAAAAIAGLTLINILGIQRTAGVAVGLAIITTAYFAYMAIAGLIHPGPVLVLPAPDVAPTLPTILSAAAIFFFAFAGYARVATLGNEVRDPKRNIPKAIVIALGAVAVIYAVLAFVMQKFLGLNLFSATAPFKDLAEYLIPVLPHQITIVVAVLASLGSMLALLAGVSRTAASMGEDRELPSFFMIRNRFGSPWVAEVVIALGAIGLVAVGDLSWVIGFSSFSVLFYYSVGHISVLRQTPNERVAPLGVAVSGFVLCWALAFTVPGPAVPVSLGILALALLVRIAVKRRQIS